MSQTEFRIALVILSAIVLFLIFWFSRPKPVLPSRTEPKMPWQREEGELAERFTSVSSDPDAEMDVPWQDAETNDFEPGPEAEQTPAPGTRPEVDFDLVISLHVMARDDGTFSGAELVVAAEKASLVYGSQGMFHRLPDATGAVEPIFSMVNRVMPGAFDLAAISELRTPGISFFMTIPNPLSGLEAWDRMYACVQRMSGLLAGEIYDEEMNLLGRQRIAAIRDQLRNYDRRQGR